MKSKSLIITWITACDYPIFRRWLKRHYSFFDEIIITWSEHFRHMKFDEFIEKSLSDIPNIKFIPFEEYEYGVYDWRNISSNRMLKHATGEWIISIEQDFITKDWNKLFDAVTEASKTYEILGFQGHQGQASHQEPYLTGNYVHPALFFIKRSLLEKTSKDFSADPKRGADHFGLITQDIERMKIPIWYTQEHGFTEAETLHQGSINHHYLNALETPGFNFHRGELFYIYNYYSIRVDVPQDDKFMELMLKMDAKLKLMFPDIDPLTDSRSIFFK